MFLSSVSSESDMFCRLKNSPSSRVRFRSDSLWTGPSPSAITYASHVTFLVWFAVLCHAVSLLSLPCAALARPVHRPASGWCTLSLQVVLCHVVLFAGLPDHTLSYQSATKLSLVQLFAWQVSTTKYVIPRVTISTFTSQSDLSELPWRSLFNRPLRSSPNLLRSPPGLSQRNTLSPLTYVSSAPWWVASDQLPCRLRRVS